MNGINWNEIKEEYIHGGGSLRFLSDKYGVSYNSLRRIANRDCWKSLRRKENRETDELKHSVDEISRKLLCAIERAAGELDSCRIVTKTKIKTQDGEQSTEQISFVPGGNVDCKDLKVLTAALKDIRDIQMVRSELDIREQEAKIRNMERQLCADGDVHVTVTLAGEMENYAQ